MKTLCLACLALFIIGCSGSKPPSDVNQTVGDVMTGQTQESSSDASAEKKEFEDDVFKVAIYPGAKEVPHTRMTMDSDVSKSYNCSFQTSDNPDKVADFYKAEGRKVGKLMDMPIGQKPGTGLRVVVMEIAKKEKIQIQATKSEKDGTTIFSVHMVIQKS